jgi:hypothetical protein
MARNVYVLTPDMAQSAFTGGVTVSLLLVACDGGKKAAPVAASGKGGG